MGTALALLGFLSERTLLPGHEIVPNFFKSPTSQTRPQSSVTMRRSSLIFILRITKLTLILQLPSWTPMRSRLCEYNSKPSRASKGERVNSTKEDETVTVQGRKVANWNILAT
jgi:hypothetical protein